MARTYVPRSVQWIVVVLSVLVLGGFVWSRLLHYGLEEGHARAGSLGAQQADGQAPPFDLPTLDGGRLRLSDLRGRVTLLVFWATWCPPCLEEIPALEALNRQLSGRPVELVTVSQDEGWEPVRALFGARSPGLRVALDPGGSLANGYGTEKLPEAYVIGRRGRLLARFVNVQPWDSADILGWFERVLDLGL